MQTDLYVGELVSRSWLQSLTDLPADKPMFCVLTMPSFIICFVLPLQVLLELKGNRDQLGLMVHLVLPVHRAMMVLLAHKAPLAHPVPSIMGVWSIMVDVNISVWTHSMVTVVNVILVLNWCLWI